MLERGTLVPDPTTYSWTPTSSDTIYCAWLGELLLHAVWRMAGWDGLFVLRYLLAFGCVALVLRHARASGLRSGPAVVAIVTIAMLATAPVMRNLKPEMLSVALTWCVLGLYAEARRLDLAGRPSALRWWAVPLVLLAWVNTHGGFLIVAPVLATILVGEALNRVAGGETALSREAMRHLVGAWLASAAAVVATPYGTAYPRQLVDEYLLGRGTTPQGAYAWNDAYRSVGFGAADTMHLGELSVAMAAILIALHVRVAGSSWRRIDFAAVLAPLAAGALYFWYLRTTFVLPAVFAFAAIGLLARDRGSIGPFVDRPDLAWAATVLVVLLGGRAVLDARGPVGRAGFAGLGFSHDVPVAEADWIARHALPRDLYNTFDSGGYLLWRLHPKHRVMVDPRAFPFNAWFDDHADFASGRDVEGFIAKYPAHAAMIDLEKAGTWIGFARSPDWRPVFYGPTAVVFVRRDAAAGTGHTDATPEPAATLDRLRNGHVALRAFEFARFVDDHDTAWRLLDQLDGPLRDRTDRLLRRSLDGRAASERERTMLTLLAALARLDGGQDDPRARLVAQGLQRVLPTPSGRPVPGDASAVAPPVVH
ncbi:MAG TPA: hypothetical protein PKC20_19545, partial [Burkholderiaceae bacterium]|nr:hypothetical protein [Burkholderiaceae bacterium]